MWPISEGKNYPALAGKDSPKTFIPAIPPQCWKTDQPVSPEQETVS